MGTIKADTVTGLADPNKATIPNTITMGSTTATLNFGNTVIANASAGSSTITGEGGSNTTNIQQGLCKAFLHYNHSTDSVLDSFNISSARLLKGTRCNLPVFIRSLGIIHKA